MPSGPAFVQRNNHYHFSNGWPRQSPPLNNEPLPDSANSYTFPPMESPEHSAMYSPDLRKVVKVKTRRLSAQHRKERERVLSNTPVGSLVQSLIDQELETREAKMLLRSAVVRLEESNQRAIMAERERKSLEDAQALQSLKVTQGVVDAQQQTAKAQQDVIVYKLQLDQLRHELRRAQQGIRSAEDERDDAERSASKARAVARKLNDERLVMFAREEGRKQGFQEGINQGRMAVFTATEAKYITARTHATPPGSGEAFIEEYEDNSSPSTEVDGGRGNHPHHPHHQPDIARGVHSNSMRKTPRPRHASLDSVPRGRSRSGATSPHSQPRHVASNGNTRVPQQPASVATSQQTAVRQELETVKEEADALKREVDLLEAVNVYGAQRAASDAQEKEKEIERLRNTLQQEMMMLRERERVKEAEREMEVQATREREAHREMEREREREREREAARQRERDLELELERHREREREAREREERERLEREREREQERERERERETEKEREKERERERQRALEKTEQDRVRELERQKAREQEREKAREQEQEREKREKERGRPTRLPYLRMPPPPNGSMSGVVPPPPQLHSQTQAPSQPKPEIRIHLAPTYQPQQIQPDPRRVQRHRTASTDTTRSPSSTTSMSALDIISFPSNSMANKNGSARGDETDRVRPNGLPGIPEGSEGRTSVATSSPPPPSWLKNPPIDHMERVLRGQDPTDVESWRRSTSDLHATPPSLSPGLLNPGFRPRGREYERTRSSDLRRTPSSGSSHVEIIIEPPSRPGSPSATSHHPTGEIEGYLSPKHGPAPPLPTDTQPVIPEYVNEAPPGFVPFPPVAHGGGPRNSSGPGNGYPRSPIYANMPLTTSTSTWSSRDSASATPRQIYGAIPNRTPPTFSPVPFAGAGPGLGSGPGVVPPSPRSWDYRAPGVSTPHHRSTSLGSAGTPASRSRDLPGSFSREGETPSSDGSMSSRRDGSMSSHSSYAKFTKTTYVDPPFFPPEMVEEEEEDEGEEDEATRRNTLANANASIGMGLGALPIPPPSFQSRR